ncbi:MAG TPA: hypothetical protein VNO22_06585 [Planctomycetota bacterium]|nr:hypothetical protein [Planctomycetota bacterium]
MNDAPSTAPNDPAPAPRDRRWFVVLAWVTLVLFALFVLGICLSVALAPEIRKARTGLGSAPVHEKA